MLDYNNLKVKKWCYRS